MINLNKVNDVDAWREQREKIRDTLLDYIGKNFSLVSDPLYEDLSEDDADLFVPDTKIIEEYTDDREHVKRMVVEYFVSKSKDDSKKVSAVVYSPAKYKKDSLPAVLCCPDLKSKSESQKYLETFEEAVCKNLAKLGYITLIPDYSIALKGNNSVRRGRRRIEGSESGSKKCSKQGELLEILSASLCVFGTWVASDIPSIGVMGRGFGAFQAILLTAMESAVQACVAIGPITQLKDKESKYNWVLNKEIDIIPELRKDLIRGEIEIDMEHIMALCAPSALLLLNPYGNEGTKRSSKEKPTYLKSVMNIYEVLGMPDALKVVNKKIEDYDDYIPIIEDWFTEWL